MPDIIDTIKQRRSIRNYQPQAIPKELLSQILEAATYAPSAHNAQPWQFIVITEDEQKNLLADAMAQIWLKELEKDNIPKNMRWATVNHSIERFTTAPVLIVACLTLEDMDTYPDVERQNIEHDLAVQSTAAAIQTLLLAAHAEGLGTCWYCAPVFCKTAVREALKIPAEVEPQALITLGYSAEQPTMPPRKPVDEVVSAEEWDNPL